MPLLDAFQEVGNTIRVGDPWLAKIDVSLPSFLAREDLPPIELPFQHVLPEVVVPRKETASSRLSLEVEIDQFHFEKDKKERADPIIQLPDSEDELDRHSAAHSPRLIVACVDPSSNEDEEMEINPRKGLNCLLAGSKKWGSSKEVPKSQVPANLPPPPSPLPITIVGLLPYLDLKKKRKVQEVKEGEVVPLKGSK